MDFSTLVAPASTWSRVTADALLVILPAGALPTGLDKTLSTLAQSLVTAGDLELSAGKCQMLHRAARVKSPRVVFSVAADASVRAVVKAAQAGLGLLKAGGTRHLAIGFAGAGGCGGAHAEALAVAALEAGYVYRHTKPSAPAAPPLDTITVLCEEAAQAEVGTGLERGRAIGEGVTLAREYANRPANHCTPGFLADEARRLGKAHGFKVEVFERQDLEKLGMGAFLAVAQGSAEPPKFIVARWQGAGRKDAPVVLAGKGITFDTGGISLKPAAEMDEMKFDMGGAASVLGTLVALSRLKARINVIGLIAATENMPGGRARRSRS